MSTRPDKRNVQLPHPPEVAKAAARNHWKPDLVVSVELDAPVHDALASVVAAKQAVYGVLDGLETDLAASVEVSRAA